MTDLLSAIREFRFLEEKRRTGGLVGDDQERWDQLRAILGERAPAVPPTPAPAPIGATEAANPWLPAPPPTLPSALVEEEPPLVDADLLEEAPATGSDPAMDASAAPQPPLPAIAFAGWPAAEEPVASPAEPTEASAPGESADALAGWPMTEEPEGTAPVEPPAAPAGWPRPEPEAIAPPAPFLSPPAPEVVPPLAAVPTPDESRELQSGPLQSDLPSDEALLSVTEFLVQAPLASAPSPWPVVPAPEPVAESLPWPSPVVVPPAPAAPDPIRPPEKSAWFSPSPPAPAPVAPREPVPWPEPVASAERPVWPQRINTAPPWSAAPAVPPPAATTAGVDPDQDLPVAVEPVAMEPDAMDLLSERPPTEEKSESRRGVFIAGEHRVVVHTLVGALKRGTIHDLDLEAHTLELSPQAGGDPEWVNSEELKAIFFMLPPGQPHLAQAGQRLTVTFHDGRQITGFSSDYRPGDPGFFLVPADTRSATARIYVFRAALRDVMAN